MYLLLFSFSSQKLTWCEVKMKVLCYVTSETHGMSQVGCQTGEII